MTPAATATGPARGTAALVFLLLLIAVALAHGRSLTFGLYLDDLAHIEQLQAADWSLRGLVDACRLELVGGAIELWWLPETTLRFFRPLAFGLMKLVYTLGDWQPHWAHLASLGWHLLACWLLWYLLTLLTRRAWLSFGLSLVFCLHPAHVGTVQWIAAQSELMVTSFLLIALLAVVQLRGWGGVPVTTSPRRWTLLACAAFAAALGCRENAVLFPLVVLGTDLLLARRTLRTAWPLYSGLVLIAVAYLLVRSMLLSGVALPPKPYVLPPGDPQFIRYVFDKLCYYLLGEFLLVPCVPIGGLPYLREHAAWFYGAAGVLVLVLIVLGWRCRREAPVTLGALALLGFVGPVLPAFESPHHLYLPGIGAIVLLGGLLHGLFPAGSRLRQRLLGTGLTLAALGCSGLTHYGSLAIDTARQVEQLMIRQVVRDTPDLRDGDTLYVANLPLIAHYLRLGVERETGRKELRVVALTWATRLLGMQTPSELRWIDRRTVECHVRDDRYFDWPIARMIEEARGEGLAQRLSEPLQTEHFTVSIAEQDERGVRALRFRFHRALDAPGVHLYWGSQTRWATRVAGPTGETDGRQPAAPGAAPY